MIYCFVVIIKNKSKYTLKLNIIILINKIVGIREWAFESGHSRHDSAVNQVGLKNWVLNDVRPLDVWNDGCVRRLLNSLFKDLIVLSTQPYNGSATGILFFCFFKFLNLVSSSS